MKSLVALLLISFQAWAQDSSVVINDFKNVLTQNQISPRAEQAFCYMSNQKVEGYQVDKLQRIASVSKIITTFHASEVLNLQKTYLTKFYISKDKLHIEGSGDPYFEEEKLLLLMQSLNDLGYTKFSSVTFDRNFLFYDIALQSHMNVTPAHTRQRLMTYFNTANAKMIRTKWLEAYRFAREENVDINTLSTPLISAKEISLSTTNPLSGLSPVVLTHKSRPLYKIIKSMNVMSKNHVAQYIYLEASKLKDLKTILSENGISASTYKLNNGSGLPVITGNTRVDNLASCRTVLRVMGLLEKNLKRYKLNLSDIMAVVGGKDFGSFRDRFLDYPHTHDAIIAKTGTLRHASSLAGFLLIDNKIPFAILNHTTDIVNAKSFQERFVLRLFHHLGQPTPMDYTKKSIFPWDGSSDFLSTF